MQKIVLINQFGEESTNEVSPTGTTPPAQALIDATPAKTGVAALSPLASNAVLTVTVTQVNAILAALQAVS